MKLIILFQNFNFGQIDHYPKIFYSDCFNVVINDEFHFTQFMNFLYLGLQSIHLIFQLMAYLFILLGHLQTLFTLFLLFQFFMFY